MRSGAGIGTGDAIVISGSRGACGRVAGSADSGVPEVQSDMFVRLEARGLLRLRGKRSYGELGLEDARCGRAGPAPGGVFVAAC